MDSIEICSCNVIHEDIVDKVRNCMIDNNSIVLMSEFFKVFSDPTRLRVLYALSISEMCVCDISVLLQMNQSAISHQLKVLKQERLIKYRREGKVVYYSLDDDHIKQIFNQGLSHVSENK